LAADADIVAGVDLRLSRKALGAGADLLVRIDDDLHLLRLRVELDEIGADAVLGGADVEAAIEAGDDGEVATALVGGLLWDGVGSRLQPRRRRGSRKGGPHGGKGTEIGHQGRPRTEGNSHGLLSFGTAGLAQWGVRGCGLVA